MEIIEKYIELLKNAIWGNYVQVDVHSEEMSQIVKLAASQGTGPLVFDQLLILNDVEIPAALRMQMKQQCLMSMMLQQSMFAILSKAWFALEQADIHPVLLKGFSLAQLYPQSHLRQWGDIDLYVGERNYYQACEVLREAFPGIEHTEHEEDEVRHYNFVFDNTVLETHRVSAVFHHPHDKRYYEQLEAQCLTKDEPKIDIEGLQITLPEETFNLFFTFLHAWNHFIETGMNMKQLCDIAVLLHAKRETIVRVRLKEMLSKLHLMEVWQLIMYILVQHLGLLQEEAPFYTEACKDRAEQLFVRIISEGSSRPHPIYDVDKMSYIKRKRVTLQMRLSDYSITKQYAPNYARHLLLTTYIHGFERIFKGK